MLFRKVSGWLSTNVLLLLQSKMAQEKGVNVSRHEVHTEDGYWLAVHRVGNPRGTPVLLVHGLLASSDQWLILGRSESYREYPNTSNLVLPGLVVIRLTLLSY